MDQIINYSMAWLSVFFSIIALIIFFTRKLYIKSRNKKILYINKILRKNHKVFGILVIVTGLIHGLYSSQEVLSLNIGSALLIVSVLMGLTWMFRSKVSKIKNWMSIHRALSTTFLLLIVLHIYDVGGIHVLDLFKEETQVNLSVDSNKDYSNNKYKDGIYNGIADGYRPGIEVEVTVKSAKITKVEIISHNEVNQRFWGRPVMEIPIAIVNSNSPVVDSISGATMTSVGIMNATVNALSDALISGELMDVGMPEHNGKGHGKFKKSY